MRSKCCTNPSLSIESSNKKLPVSLNEEIEHECLKGLLLKTID